MIELLLFVNILLNDMKSENSCSKHQIIILKNKKHYKMQTKKKKKKSYSYEKAPNPKVSLMKM